MEEAKKAAEKNKVNHWKNLKAEFRKIIWPDRETLVKKTGAVLVISVVMGVVIALLDMLIQFGFSFII
ncbi:MAG: preprotein translocase subunit SecE [Lachnospiraceae bacterium]|nr:preprotein translocase subunit SecE [Lachnospiraceae bacterium]